MQSVSRADGIPVSKLIGIPLLTKCTKHSKNWWRNMSNNRAAKMRAGGNPNVPNTPESEWGKGQSYFIRCDLSEQDKADVRDWPMWENDADGLLKQLVDGGHTISLKPDGQNGGYAAYCVPTPTNKAHEGMALAGRGSTPIKALRQLCYKQFVLLKGIWGDRPNKDTAFDYED